MRHISPNFITSLRLFIFAPLAVFALMHGCLGLALAVMVLGEITDGLDGFIARRTGQVSNFGKIYDPMCDSISHIIIWMSFLAIGWASVYLVIVFFVRDSVVANIRICLAKHNVVLSARMSGKVKAVAQAAAQLLLVAIHLLVARHFLYSGSWLEHTQSTIVTIAALVTIFSLVDYAWSFYRVVKDKKSAFI